MNNRYMALGLSLDGTNLVFQPRPSGIRPSLIPLQPANDLGMRGSAIEIGTMLITALGAFHNEVDGFALTTAAKMNDGRVLGLWDDPHAVMRTCLVGLGYAAGPEPSLLLHTYADDFQLTTAPFPAHRLAAKGPAYASGIIGEVALRTLSSMNPSMARQFPELFA